MTDHSREIRMSEAFVRLADTLAVDYDVLDILDTLVRKCVELLDTDAGGLMIADPSTRKLRSVVSTSRQVAVLEAAQLDAGDGPAIDCFASGRSVAIPDLAEDPDQWPALRRHAATDGYRAMHAFPLRLRGTAVGVMTLYSTEPGGLTPRNAAAGQALADVATIGILQERDLQSRTVVIDQLQRALDTRFAVEQAKGIIAQSAGVGMDEAFDLLRSYARDRRLRLGDVAAGVADRTLDISTGARAGG